MKNIKTFESFLGGLNFDETYSEGARNPYQIIIDCSFNHKTVI